MSPSATGSPLERTVREHDEIRALLAAFRAFLDQPVPPTGASGWGRELGERLARLEGTLALHFAGEERDELPEDLALRLPHVAHRAARLKREHVRILGDIAILAAATRECAGGAAPASGPRLREWTRALLNQVARHEQVETGLIQEAWLEDLGAPE